MDDLTDDDLFLDAVDAICWTFWRSSGNDPRARFGFFKRLLTVAEEKSGRYLS